MDLTDVRSQIDEIDAQLLDLFGRRMALARDVAQSSLRRARPSSTPAREREKLADVAAKAPDGLQEQSVALFSLLS